MKVDFDQCKQKVWISDISDFTNSYPKSTFAAGGTATVFIFWHLFPVNSKSDIICVIFHSRSKKQIIIKLIYISSGQNLQSDNCRININLGSFQLAVKNLRLLLFVSFICMMAPNLSCYFMYYLRRSIN